MKKSLIGVVTASTLAGLANVSGVTTLGGVAGRVFASANTPGEQVRRSSTSPAKQTLERARARRLETLRSKSK